MFCTKCGKEIENDYAVCPYCGANQKDVENNTNNQVEYNKKTQTQVVCGGIASFIFPIVGLILFLIWRTNRPNDAKVVGIAGLCGFVINVLYQIINLFI